MRRIAAERDLKVLKAARAEAEAAAALAAPEEEVMGEQPMDVGLMDTPESRDE